MFAERIKELGGEPTSEVAGKVVKGQEVKAIYSSDSDSEDDTIFVYNELRKVCVDNGDILTAKLFETIIGEEQIHLNYFDNIRDHIETLAIPSSPRSPVRRLRPAGPPRALPSLPQPRTRADTLEKLETPGKGAFFSKDPFPKTVSAARSPSCGSGEIYDGSFTGTRVPGEGVFARMAREAGLEIWSEETFTEGR